MIPLWAAKLGAGAVALAVAAGYCYHLGGQRVQRKWNAQVQQDKAAADAAREVDRLRARSADADYQARRAAAARREPSPESAYALKATICPPAGVFGRPLELGDVPVPGAVLDRLRDAGADY